MLKRLMAFISALALLVGCAAAETALEPAANEYAVQQKTIPFIFLSRKSNGGRISPCISWTARPIFPLWMYWTGVKR
ncbi:MAG: hypothetical protein IJ124_03800 [Clostridia bacterium]|nr:hypothetical protein [Clostridia bacterium]